MKILISFLLIAISWPTLASDESPYAGEERRSVKSLSEHEIVSLQRGEGMGFAKLAELNHFPGPKHVLEISSHLKLSPSQLTATQSIFDDMHSMAVDLGENLIHAEAKLDREFELGIVTAQSLESQLLEIGKLRAQLRYVHLEAHLRQKQILRPEQISTYDTVRGYQDGAHDHGEHSK